MGEQTEKINIIELLMGIKEDVSSIKTDMANFKESQRTEKDTIMKEISDVRTDYKRDLADMEARFTTKINGKSCSRTGGNRKRIFGTIDV